MDNPNITHLLCGHHDQGVADCLAIADERYTMDFTDVEGGAYLYWCSACGPAMHRIDKVLTKACEAHPEFAKRLQQAIHEVKSS